MKPKEVKTNYSFRLSDEAVTLIDKQAGNTRTEKFENLVFSRVQEIEKMDTAIASKKKELAKLTDSISAKSKIFGNLEQIERYVNYALQNASIPD